MSEVKATREVGDTLRFEETVKEFQPFSENGSLTSPSTVEITIENADGTKVVDAESMIEDSTGKFYFTWDTQGLDAVNYKVTVFVQENNTEETSIFFVRLTD